MLEVWQSHKQSKQALQYKTLTDIKLGNAISFTYKVTVSWSQWRVKGETQNKKQYKRKKL